MRLHDSSHGPNPGVGGLPKLRHLLLEYTFTSEVTHESTNYERAVLTFPKAHSTTQAFGDTAEILSRDQKIRMGDW